MAKLTTQAGGVSLGRGVAAIAGLTTVMILSRLMGKADYGTYRQVWLVFFTLAPLMELGIPPSASFFIPQLAADKIKTYLIQNSLLLVGSGLILGAVLFTSGAVLEKLFRNPGLVLYLRAFALFPALTLSFNLTENTLIALGRAGTAGWISGAGAIIQATLILSVVAGGGSLELLFRVLSLWALLRWLVAAGALLWYSRHFKTSWDTAALKGQLAFALPMGAAAMAGILARQFDKVIVSTKFDASEFAVYANGSYEIPLINVLTLSVTAVLVPAIVRANTQNDREGIRRLWHGSARRMAWLFFPAFIFLLIAAKPLVILLFSEKYVDSANVLRVFAFLLPLRIALYSAFLRALGNSRAILLISLGAVIISAGLAIILIQFESLGYLGPALASIAGAYWAAWFSIRMSLKTLQWQWHQFFPWKTLGALMLVAIAAAIPTLIARLFVGNQSALIQLAGLGLVYGTSYLAIGEFTGAARPKEWIQAIRDLLARR
jgi:O-antigen/teichoic acid export membrane protein